MRVTSVGPRRCADLAQPHCDDPVLAAAYFKPNAPGRWELSSLRALSERQLLKSTATYLAERVLLAVTTLEVVAIARRRPQWLPPRVVTWKRASVAVDVVPLRLGPLEPGRAAVYLSDLRPFPRLEVAELTHDDATVHVLHLLGVDLC